MLKKYARKKQLNVCFFLAFVLYSGQIENPMTEFESGFNAYRVQPIIMKGKCVKEVFDKISVKLAEGIPLSKEDLVPLTLCTLMSGEMSQKERIIRALDITRIAKDTVAEADRIEAVVYSMAEKFLDSVTIEQLKEAVGMTRLGQMMYNDGLEAGMEKGVETTRLENARNLIGILSDELIAEKIGLPLETVQKLHEEKLQEA